MKKFSLSRYLAVAALGIVAALVAIPVQLADAQAVSGSVYTYPAQLRTYAAAKVGIAPVASATDLFTITGAAGKRVQVRKIHCDGTSTAAATALVQIVKRSTANSAGSSTAVTAVAYNSAPGIAASASVKAYTGNPTAGTLVGAIATGELTTTTLATTAVGAPGVNFDFSNQYVFLNSGSEVLAVNANGASFTSGASLNCSVEWSEA